MRVAAPVSTEYWTRGMHDNISHPAATLEHFAAKSKVLQTKGAYQAKL